MILHCPRCSTPVPTGSSRCPNCEFTFRSRQSLPSEEQNYNKIITLIFLTLVLVTAVLAAVRSGRQSKALVSSPTEIPSSTEFKLTLPTPEGGDLVKEVIITKHTLTWKTSFPSGTKAFVVFENSLPANTDNIGIIPLHLISNEKYEVSVDGEIFYDNISSVYGKAYACLFVVDNNAWYQPEQTRKIVRKTKDKLSCIEEISPYQADAIIQKLKQADLPASIQNKLDPFLYQETLVGYKLAIIKEVKTPW